MINFVIKDNKGQDALLRIKKMVLVSTSLVLVIYIVVTGGMTGWTAWVSSNQKQTSAESDGLIRQINTMFDTEVVVRNLANRVNLVEVFLQDRGDASTAAYLARKTGANIFKWEYSPDGAETVGIYATSPATLREYSDYLGANYNKVQTSRIEWNPDEGWSGMFIVTGRKKT
jgi:hypothetical protein